MDGIDILLHAGIAVFGSIFVGRWNRHVALAINTVAWPVREALQHHGGLFNSPQSFLEWAVPVCLGGIVWLAYDMGAKLRG